MSAAAIASASIQPLEPVFSASALIRALTRVSFVVWLKVLLIPRREQMSTVQRGRW
jgi:hypothetical protein